MVAVDGWAVVPLPGTRFGMAMAQRPDIKIDLPGDGAFPVPALREGTRARTGLIMANAGTPAQMIMLTGTVQPGVRAIDGQIWGAHSPIAAVRGARVELKFHTMSVMGHPMHLHGPAFQVVRINGCAVRGAMRDTDYVPPICRVTVALVAALPPHAASVGRSDDRIRGFGLRSAGRRAPAV